MTQRQMQFRVGLLALAGLAVALGLTFSFSSLPELLAPSYRVAVRFPEAAGLAPGVPVRQYGLEIGRVDSIAVDFQNGGVVATLRLREDHPIRSDAQPRIARTLFGDASIDFTAGTSTQPLAADALLEGEQAADPMEVVASLQRSAESTLSSIERTSQQFGDLASNMNTFLETEQGSVSEVVERAAVALTELTVAMSSASETLNHVNGVIGDPQTQANLQQTLAALPQMVEEARLTVAAVRGAVGNIDQTMQNLSQATAPLAQSSPALTASLGRSLGTLEQALADISQLAQVLSDRDGSLGRFAGDPRLYESLNDAAGDLAAVMNSLEPTIKDLRIFADKVARHPELLGVRGAISGSSGLKDVPTARGQSPSAADGLRR